MALRVASHQPPEKVQRTIRPTVPQPSVPLMKYKLILKSKSFLAASKHLPEPGIQGLLVADLLSQ